MAILQIRAVTSARTGTMEKKNVNSPVDRLEKIVFSRTLETADWENTCIIKGDMIEEVRKLKKNSGKDLRILGSGSVITQLAEAGLIDVCRFMVDPVVLESGRSTFNGLSHELDLKLISTRTFKSGVILLSYQPL